jgi:hypothetical protein
MASRGRAIADEHADLIVGAVTKKWFFEKTRSDNRSPLLAEERGLEQSPLLEPESFSKGPGKTPGQYARGSASSHIAELNRRLKRLGTICAG